MAWTDRARGQRGHRADGLARRGGARVGRGGALARVRGRARVARGAAGGDAAARPPDAARAHGRVCVPLLLDRCDTDWAEFADLSERAWPGFESSYDAHICGFFRSLDVRPPDARVLLLTRYASLAVWEASRTADTGRSEFQRRHKLTRSTIVCTAVPG